MARLSRDEVRPFVNEEAAARSGEVVGFSFGANWQKLVDRLDTRQLEQATDSLLNSFGGEQFPSRRFIDVGCGSGLFSLAAMHLGAREVVSVDVDPNAVACANYLRKRERLPANWTVKDGSILDANFVRTLGCGELVFSWGVIHHTGDLWSAFTNLTQLVCPGGLLCVAIYNRPRAPKIQISLKRTYNRAPRAVRPLMVAGYGTALLGLLAVRGRNPVSYVKGYGAHSRGMDYWRDVEDWLGGLPFEYAAPVEVHKFAERNGFRLEAELVRRPGGCNEYLLRRVT